MNIYDEEHNSVVQSDPQYTVGTVFLYGYTGDVVISCDSQRSSYITDLHVYDTSGNDMSVSLGTNIYSPDQNRSGKKFTAPSGAVKAEFKYRTAYSGGALVENVMVTHGNLVPSVYVPCDIGNVLIDSPYITMLNKNQCAYVALNGNDDNDGLTFNTAVATFAKALSISTTVVAERGFYAQRLHARNTRGIKLLPYNDGITYSAETPVLPKVQLLASTFINCDDLYIEDYAFESGTNGVTVSAVEINYCNDVVLNHCEANNSTIDMGFEVNYSNITFNGCYATGNKYDGFNFHGYGTSYLNNCVSVDNEDDGCSHHDGCIGFINGGTYDGNGKAGIAPAYGAQVDINNVVCKGNVKGIAYMSTGSEHADMVGTINSCVLIDNTTGLQVDARCSVIAINCKYSGNTTDKDATGTLTEY